MPDMPRFMGSISARERLLLGLAFIVGLGLIVYLYLIEPKMAQLAQLKDRLVPQSEQDLAWVKQALAVAEQQKKNQKVPIIEGPLLTVIEQTAEKARVRAAIRRMQPGQNQSVKIWLDEAKFDDWLRWLDLLNKQNVNVQSTSINNKSPGLVDIRLTLARP